MKRNILVILVIINSFFVFSQKEETLKFSEDEINNTADKACECVENINFEGNFTHQNDSIRKCVLENLQVQQIIKQTSKIKLDSLVKKDDSIKKINIKILLSNDENSESFKQVEAKLLNNCSFVKKLASIDNNKQENSVSFDRKAIENYEKGNYYSAKKEYEKAISYYKKALKFDKNYAFAWDNLGLSYRKTNQFKKAIKAYKMSLKVNPKGRVPLMNMGVAYNYLKQYKKAIKAYTKFTQNFSDDPEGFYGLSRAYMFSKNYPSALENSIIALKIYIKQKSPYRADAENLIRIIYAQMKEGGQLDKFTKITTKYNLNIHAK